MNRWRIVVVILVLIAAASVLTLAGGNRGGPGTLESPRLLSRMAVAAALENSFNQLPRWVPSITTLLALFIFGAANLYLFTARVRNMAIGLTVSWNRFLQVTLAGLAYGLLFVLGGLLASFARVTFPLTLLTGLTLIVLSLWGYLALAYAIGHLLLKEAGWFKSPLTALMLGLLLLHALVHLPFAGALAALLGIGAGLGIVITTRFGSMKPWDVKLLLEESNE